MRSPMARAERCKGSASCSLSCKRKEERQEKNGTTNVAIEHYHSQQYLHERHNLTQRYDVCDFRTTAVSSRGFPMGFFLRSSLQRNVHPSLQSYSFNVLFNTTERPAGGIRLTKTRPRRKMSRGQKQSRHHDNMHAVEGENKKRAFRFLRTSKEALPQKKSISAFFPEEYHDVKLGLIIFKSTAAAKAPRNR